MRCETMRCDTKRCKTMRSDASGAVRCDAMRDDAMRCDAIRCSLPDDDGLVYDAAVEVGLVGVNERHVAVFWRARRYQWFGREKAGLDDAGGMAVAREREHGGVRATDDSESEIRRDAVGRLEAFVVRWQCKCRVEFRD